MRKRTFEYIFIFFFCLQGKVLFAADHKTDSLLTLLKSTQEDTVRIARLNLLAGNFLDRSSYDSAQFFSDKAIKLIKQDLKLAAGNVKLEDRLAAALSESYGNNANALFSQGEYPKAVDFYFMALKIEQDRKNRNGIIKCWVNIGAVFNSEGDYRTALEYYFKALKLIPFEGSLTNAEKRRLCAILGNIGTAFRDLNELKRSLEYYFKALPIAEEIKIEAFQSIVLGNIGIAYQKQADSLSALKSNGSASAILYESAEKYYKKALELDEKIFNKNGVARHLGNMGQLFIDEKKYPEAEKYLLRALAISEEIGSLNLKKDEHQSLSNFYSLTGKPAVAFDHYKQYIALRDSILNKENTKKSMKTEMKFEFDKKEALLTAQQDKERELAAAESKKQRIIIISVAAGLLLVLFFSAFIFRALRVTRKQKIIIENQKKLVEEKQVEILDSIRYAKRIQQSLLPTEKYIDRSYKRLNKNT